MSSEGFTIKPENSVMRAAAMLQRMNMDTLLTTTAITPNKKVANDENKPSSHPISPIPLSTTNRTPSSSHHINTGRSTPLSPRSPSTSLPSPRIMPRLQRHTHMSLLGHHHRGWLLNSYGEKIKIETLKGQITGLYFSANWSLPCRVITAELSRIYMELKAQSSRKPFEIVWINFDHVNPTSSESSTVRSPPSKSSTNSPDLHKPTVHMDFGLHLPDQDRVTRRKLVKLFRLQRIPALVLLDESGEVITTKGVPLITQRGADGYPFKRDEVVDGEARRKFEQEVVEIFAHLDKKNRLQVDTHDLEKCLLAGGVLPAPAVRACATQMLSDIASPSMNVDVNPTSGLVTAAAHASGCISLHEWKAYFSKVAFKHGAEFPLKGLRRMLGVPESTVNQVPYDFSAAPPATYSTIEYEAKVNEDQRQYEQQRFSSPSSPNPFPTSPSHRAYSPGLELSHAHFSLPSSRRESTLVSALKSSTSPATHSLNFTSPSSSSTRPSVTFASSSTPANGVAHDRTNDYQLGDAIPNSPINSPRQR